LYAVSAYIFRVGPVSGKDEMIPAKTRSPKDDVRAEKRLFRES
jgi:hypothetical protein